MVIILRPCQNCSQEILWRSGQAAFCAGCACERQKESRRAYGVSDKKKAQGAAYRRSMGVTTRMGRPPRYPDKPIPPAREDTRDMSAVLRAESGPDCVACGRNHPVDNRHDRQVAS